MDGVCGGWGRLFVRVNRLLAGQGMEADERVGCVVCGGWGRLFVRVNRLLAGQRMEADERMGVR